jgi:hypothetical protein
MFPLPTYIPELHLLRAGGSERSYPRPNYIEQEEKEVSK